MPNDVIVSGHNQMMLINWDHGYHNSWSGVSPANARSGIVRKSSLMQLDK